MSRKLIIGCGYLGRRVAHEWLARGNAVSALTRTPAGAERLQRMGVEPLIGDVTDPESLPAFPVADCVLYAVGYDRTAGKPRQKVSVDGLANVLSQLPEATRRLVYISSTSVYGQEAGEWIDEASECRPTRSNGQVCLDAEQLLLRWSQFGKRGGLPETVVLRLAGIYGPNRLLRSVDALKAGAPIPVNPEGYLNLIHVDDAVAAVLAAEDRGRSGATYLVCDDRPVTRREYYEKLAESARAPSPRFASSAATVEDRRSDGLNKRCRNARMRQELGVELQFPTIDVGLPQALSETE